MKAEDYSTDDVKQLIAIVYTLAQRNHGRIVITEDEFAALPETKDVSIRYPIGKGIFKTTEFPCVYNVDTKKYPTEEEFKANPEKYMTDDYIQNVRA